MKGQFVFLYPWVLTLLGLVPVLAVWFLFSQRRYWRDAFAFSQVSVLKKLKHLRYALWQQRVLPFALLLAIACGIVGLAQPALKTKVATQNSYLMLVLDISISMEATDLSPNRLEVAKASAIEFTRDLPDGVRLGLEFFAGNSFLVTPPVEDHELVVSYLKSLQMEDLRQGTAIGDALITAMESLQATIHKVLPSEKQHKSKATQPQGTIILITDGESNLGISPAYATEEASRQRIPVYTIGIGEEAGAYVRGGIFTHLDESTLQTIAQQTGGSYYRARSLKDFKGIYRKIGQKTLSYEEKTISLMPWCLGISLALLLFAFTWSTHHRRC